MKLLTASDLRLGDVVYRTAGAGWSRAIGDALLMDEEAAMAALTQAKQQETLVVNAYLVEMADVGTPAPREAVRENIRARGPTIHPQFAKQAQQ